MCGRRTAGGVKISTLRVHLPASHCTIAQGSIDLYNSYRRIHSREKDNLCTFIMIWRASTHRAHQKGHVCTHISARTQTHLIKHWPHQRDRHCTGCAFCFDRKHVPANRSDRACLRPLLSCSACKDWVSAASRELIDCTGQLWHPLTHRRDRATGYCHKARAKQSQMTEFPL